MKKNVFAAVCVAAFLSAGSVFAAPEFKLSMGVGGIFTNDWTAMVSKGKDGFKQSDLDKNLKQMLGGGANVWFDATFVEVNLGLIFGNRFSPNADSVNKANFNEDNTADVFAMRAGVLAKYPIELNEKVMFFPALGFESEMAITLKNHKTGKGEDGKDDGIFAYGAKQNSDGTYPKSLVYLQHSALWFKAGVGADFALGEKVYLRTEALYGIRLNTLYETDALALGNNKDYWSIIGHGVDVKLGVGFKFW